jgi:histidinol-phosphatase (PHP family)
LPEPILYESHCHTPLCNHAEGDPTEYAEAAERAGLKGIIFTCHCPLPDGISSTVRMRPAQYDIYHDLIARTRERFAGRVDVRAGLESDFYPGVEPWLEELHERYPLHHVLGSIHPQLLDYRREYFTGDVFAYQQLYFDHLAQAAETGLFDTLAHPDLIKNMPPAAWKFDRIEPFIAKSLDRIAATGVAMELNTSGANKAYPEMNPGPRMLVMMCERDIPVMIGADAHVPERVGDGYVTALQTLREAGYTHVHVTLERKRRAIEIDVALESLGVVV